MNGLPATLVHAACWIKRPRCPARLAGSWGSVPNSLDSLFPNSGFSSWLGERNENLGTRRSSIATWVQTHTVFNSKQVLRLTGAQSVRDPLQPFVELLQRET